MVIAKFEASDKELEYDRDTASFFHTYTVVNEGPSPTNTETSVEIFVPKVEFGSVASIEPNECNLKVPGTTEVFNTGVMELGKANPICCDRFDCQVFTCTFKKGWQAKDMKEISIKIDFTAANATKNSQQDSFAIFTHAR